jgi:hypothetical protein
MKQVFELIRSRIVSFICRLWKLNLELSVKVFRVSVQLVWGHLARRWCSELRPKSFDPFGPFLLIKANLLKWSTFGFL